MTNSIAGKATEAPYPGRVRNAAATRARILAAAQNIFSNRSYSHAALRDIAAEAKVNVALVARYFGSKEKLFEAALQGTLWRDTLWNQPREGFGKRVVRSFIEEAGDLPNSLPMLVHAASDPVAQTVAQRFICDRVLAPTAQWLGGEEAEQRASEILALCAGFYTYRILMPLPCFTGSVESGARKWLEDALQAVVDAAP